MEKFETYVIANLEVLDAEEYRKYEKGFFPILKKHNGEFITFDDNVKNNEGLTPLKGRTILFGFKKSDDAERWFSDPECIVILNIRHSQNIEGMEQPRTFYLL